MSFFKRLVLFFFDTINSLRFKKIIKDEDKKYNKVNDNSYNDNLYQNFYDNGYLILENYISSEEIDKIKKDLKFEKKKVSWFYSNLVVKPNSVIEKILEDQKIKKILKKYLGEDAKLDLIEANKYVLNPDKISSSEKWHYDVVGRRVKIFLFLNSCDAIFTKYADGSNNISHNYYSTNGSRATDNFISKKFKKISTIKPKEGSLFIFDTNGFHKGVYRNDVKSKDISRLTLQMEFSSKSKSDKLFPIAYSNIGVRNIFFSKKCKIENYLIDREYINELNGEEIIFYDQEYSTN